MPLRVEVRVQGVREVHVRVRRRRRPPGRLSHPGCSGARRRLRSDTGGPRAVTLVTRLARELADLGGWGEHTVALPEGTWTDALTGRSVRGGEPGTPTRIADLLADLPVALLVREG